MRLETAGQRLKDYVLSADDGTLMRHAFHALLAAAAVFVVIDWHEISSASPNSPASIHLRRVPCPCFRRLSRRANPKTHLPRSPRTPRS